MGATSRLSRHRKCLVLLSGGIDSATLTYWLKRQGFAIEAVHFDYGQGQINGERECAMTIARKSDTLLHVIETALPSDSMKNVLLTQGSCAQISNAAAFGDVVCMCIMAATFALTHGFDSIALGVNVDNTKAHPPLNTVFFRTIEKLVSLWTGNKIRVLTPFLQKDKSSVMRIGAELDVPYADSWSCGINIEKHCGKCVECLARKRNFKKIRLHDPTEYEC
jgi:7-cyano-7-deazaguanine synthase